MNLDTFHHKNIHIVGISGSEGSAIFSFLLNHGITTITGHDFIKPGEIEKNFKRYHKGINGREKETLWQQFNKNISTIRLNLESKYLSGIEDADIIFVPQSWRLYAQNKPLCQLKDQRAIPLYSLTRLYLEFSPARIIALTGTVGKGSVANMIYQALIKQLPRERKVYFAGNETWRLQVADILDKMTSKDILILEISHRQLMDGIEKGPDIALLTNLYPNHLDELPWEEYKKSKFPLFASQDPSQLSLLNFDIPSVKSWINRLRSKIVFYSPKIKKMNTINIQKLYDQIMNTKSVHYSENILAALSVIDLLGIDPKEALQIIKNIPPLTARLELIHTIDDINFYDDIKSTTPWGTIAGVNKLGSATILICGGNTKNIRYDTFTKHLKGKIKFCIIIQSQLSQELGPTIKDIPHQIVSSVSEAIEKAYQIAEQGDNILISPAAAFFYTKFIAQKESIKKLITSLLPKEKVLAGRE